MVANPVFGVFFFLQRWSEAADLTFERKDEGATDIQFGFHTRYHDDTYPFDGTGRALAHAEFPGCFNQIGGNNIGDVHFDDQERYSLYVLANPQSSE